MQTPAWLNTISRLIDGALNAINRHNKDKATDDAANTISNGGVQHDIDTNISDLAGKTGNSKDQ